MRPSVESLLQYDWIKMHKDKQEVHMNQQISISANLLQYQKTSIAQAWVCSIIANQMTDEQTLQKARTAFLQWDTDQNGVLSRDEIEENMARICQYFNMEEPDVQNMFEAADIDGDGQIDFTDFLAAATDKRKLLTLSNLKRTFKMLDRDGDGYINLEDISAHLGSTPNLNVQSLNAQCNSEAIFNQLDRNWDGRVSFDDFCSHMGEVFDKRASLYLINRE